MMIRYLREDETEILKDFLYEAIYIPEGVKAPERSVIELPELRLYYEDFGSGQADCCMVAEEEGKNIGAVWSRIMSDYGHVDDETPSLAVSVKKEYRGRGIGTSLLKQILGVLKEKGYQKVSLSVQKANPAVRMYRRCGFQTVSETAEEYIMIHDLQSDPPQQKMTLAEYFETGCEKWFLTGKKKYPLQAMMVSRETSFRNELEGADYTVSDDGVTVIMKGTAGELWPVSMDKAVMNYSRPDGRRISIDDFARRDTFIDLVSIAAPDSCYAMFVPAGIALTVRTASGYDLHVNLSGVAHGSGDYLICRKGEDGQPDLMDIWVVNGILFPQTYDTSHQNTCRG